MKRRMSPFLLCALLSAAGFSTAALAQDDAGEKSWSLGIGYDYYSKYVFRGIDLLDGEPVHNPYVFFGAGGFSAYYYGYYGDIGENGPRYEEADFGLDYTFSLGDKASLKVGALTYQYLNDDSGSDTSEAYAALSFDVPLKPTLTYNYDFDVFDGGYAALGVSHSVPLGGTLSLGLSAALGVDFGYNDPESSGDLNDLLLGVDLPWQVSDKVLLHARYQRSVALQVLDDIGQDDVSIVTVGGSVTF